MSAVQFDLTQDFPVGLERLWAALGRRDYIERKYLSLGSSSLRLLKFSADAQSIEVEIERQAPVARDELPVWARVLSGERQAMHHGTRWRRAGPDRIDVELDIQAAGLRVGAKGIGSVVEAPRGIRAWRCISTSEAPLRRSAPPSPACSRTS